MRPHRPPSRSQLDPPMVDFTLTVTMPKRHDCGWRGVAGIQKGQRLGEPSGGRAPACSRRVQALVPAPVPGPTPGNWMPCWQPDVDPRGRAALTAALRDGGPPASAAITRSPGGSTRKRVQTPRVRLESMTSWAPRATERLCRSTNPQAAFAGSGRSYRHVRANDGVLHAPGPGSAPGAGVYAKPRIPDARQR